jgi:hypothetical protein
MKGSAEGLSASQKYASSMELVVKNYEPDILFQFIHWDTPIFPDVAVFQYRELLASNFFRLF